MIIQAHLGIIMALEVMLDWMDQQCVGKNCLFLSNFSAKNLLINSLQAHQHIRLLLILFIISRCHYLPMGLPDDNPSSFGDHYDSGGHAGLDGLSRFR
jgi:hypothetical protein